MPVKGKTKKVHKRYFYYFVFQQEKSLLMKRREGKDIWLGLYDFYLVEKEHPMNIEKIIQEDISLQKAMGGNKVVEISENYKHVLARHYIFAV